MDRSGGGGSAFHSHSHRRRRTIFSKGRRGFPSFCRDTPDGGNVRGHDAAGDACHKTLFSWTSRTPFDRDFLFLASWPRSIIHQSYSGEPLFLKSVGSSAFAVRHSRMRGFGLPEESGSPSFKVISYSTTVP